MNWCGATDAGMRYVEVGAADGSPCLSVADALEALAIGVGLSKTDTATIHVGKLRLAMGNDVLLVRVETSKRANVTSFVWLKTAASILGRCEGKGALQVIDPEVLDNAVVDFDGCVTAKNGQTYRSIQVDVRNMGVERTETQIRVLCALMQALPDSANYFRSARDGWVSNEKKDMIPENEFVDFAKLRELRLPSLKEIVFRVRDGDPDLGVTDQAIANALQDLGLRVPRCRPRSTVSH